MRLPPDASRTRLLHIKRSFAPQIAVYHDEYIKEVFKRGNMLTHVASNSNRVASVHPIRASVVHLGTQALLL